MKADRLTLERVFEHTERLEAPLFQRPYVWKRDKNWAPLWEAAEIVADKRLAGEVPRPHFLGTIVLDQLKTPTGKVHARQIIDGQQRLTTLQLLLAAAHDLCRSHDDSEYAQAFERLTRNYVPRGEDPDEFLKVWPTNADREDFRAVMTAGSPEAVRRLPHSNPEDKWLVPDAYLYFAANIEHWLTRDGGADVGRRLESIHRALKEDLHLVVIDLEAQDDAQVIFETLNALGTPLLPADLVKNYLFHLAQAQGDDTQALYEQYWRTFDTDKAYWRQEIRQGRLKRPRLDFFLNHYLTLMTGEDIAAAHLFAAYRDHVTKTDGSRAAVHMESFRSYADVYQRFDDFQPGTREELFFYRLAQMDTTTVLPLLLEVFKRYGAEGHHANLHQILLDIESFLVRRAVCELTTKNYNKLFVEMAKSLRAADDFSPGAVRRFLVERTADVGRWPADEEFQAGWLTVSFSKRLKTCKQRMILEALESSLRSEKTEEVRIERKLTVEHLLPKEWRDHWPLVASEDSDEAREKAASLRGEMLHKVGNLTLLTAKLNPSVSNGPWEKKHQEILKHSALNLNRSLPECWNELLIHKRSEDLFKEAVKVWPHPGKG